MHGERWLVLLVILVASACDENNSSGGTAATTASPAAAPPTVSTPVPSSPPAPSQGTTSSPPIASAGGAATTASAAPASSGTATATSTDTLTVLASQFTDRVEKSNPVGDSSALASVPKATYWMDVANPGDATQLTLVWKHDGQEVARQSLDVGKAPHWRTWGSHPRRAAHLIEVLVLDGAGNTIKTDSATIPATTP
jgi:hypothetical protein